MRTLLLGRKMKATDAKTIQEIGIPSMVLMERAAMAVAAEAEKAAKKDEIVWAVCGSGKIRQGGADFMRNRTVPEAGISRNYKIARGKPAGGEVVYEDCADSARSNKGKS